MKFLKLIMFIILSACSVATYAKNKEKLVIVHVTDLPKQYSFSPNTSSEVQSVSDKPLNVKKVVVNRGACLALPNDRTKNLPSYGSRAEYLMGGCYAKHITEIAVYLDNNQVVVFNFNN